MSNNSDKDQIFTQNKRPLEGDPLTIGSRRDELVISEESYLGNSHRPCNSLLHPFVDKFAKTTQPSNDCETKPEDPIA
jgi:hypothetical protein